MAKPSIAALKWNKKEVKLPKILIAGVDEAGRGPLAGPVYAAAVILDVTRPIQGLNDSKLLTEQKRLMLAAQIKTQALDYAVEFATAEEIDSINILQATLLAMQRAILKLKIAPAHILIDGTKAPNLSQSQECVIKGDLLIPAISAASILAKVARDKIMHHYAKIYPQYDFAKHKGYGTKEHLAAIEKFGGCPIHRQSFAPINKP